MNSQAGFNARNLAKKLGCSQRSVYRDIAVIQKAGFQLYHDPDYSEGGAYRFRDRRGVLRAGLVDPFYEPPENGQGFVVEVEFASEVAELVSDCCCHPSQHVQRHRSGKITLHMNVTELDDLTWWVLRFGPQAKVNKPKKLAMRVRDLAKQTASLYSPPQNRSKQ